MNKIRLQIFLGKWIRIMLEIQTILQKILQTAAVVSNYW